MVTRSGSSVSSLAVGRRPAPRRRRPRRRPRRPRPVSAPPSRTLRTSAANVHVFDPSMSSCHHSERSSTPTSTAQKDTQTAQFATTAGLPSCSSPVPTAVEDNVGFYTSVAGLGQNPDDVTINGDVTVDAFNSSDAGNATQNFWRVGGEPGHQPEQVAPTGGPLPRPAPFRRIDVHGGLRGLPGLVTATPPAASSPTPRCPVSQVSSVSQQQWYSKRLQLRFSWSGSVWNMVFSGVTGARRHSRSRTRR